MKSFLGRFGNDCLHMVTAALTKELLGRIAVYDDVAAYKELFLLYHQRLLQFACSITCCRELSEEVVSDVFQKVWTTRKNLQGIANPHLYLYVSVKNLSINRLLEGKREQSFSLDDTVVEFRSFSLNPEQFMITWQMYGRLQMAVGQLPPRCRLIFKLVKEDGLKYREVAELLQLSLRTVEHQVSVALRNLGNSFQLDLARTIPH